MASMVFEEDIYSDSYKGVIKSLKKLEGLRKYLPDGTYILRDKGPNKYNLSSRENNVSLDYTYIENKELFQPTNKNTNVAYEIGGILYKFLIDLSIDTPLDAVVFPLPMDRPAIVLSQPKYGVYWLVVK